MGSALGMITRMGSAWRRRWAFLRWPLAKLAERTAAVRGEGIYNGKALARRYPLRGLRYWWAGCAIEQEWQRHNRRLVIVDVGCGKGNFRRYVGDEVPAQWIGVDWRVNRPELADAGYEQLHACDLDKPLPLPDRSADVVVFLHVLEHLPRPQYTLSELSRILRPGGILLAGSPVAPRWVARLREWHLRRQLERGQRKPGKHVNSFWPGRWRTLVSAVGLRPELLTGAYLLRWAGNPLDNTRAWVRLNQLWGALFPSLGGEVYIMARHGDPSGATLPAMAARPVRSPARAFSFGRLGAVAGTLVLALSLLLLTASGSKACPVIETLAAHQDGNDSFYALAHPSLQSVRGARVLPVLDCPTELPGVLGREQGRSRDVHVLVAHDHLPTLAQSFPDLRIVARLSIDGTRFYLVGTEEYGDPLPI